MDFYDKVVEIITAAGYVPQDDEGLYRLCDPDGTGDWDDYLDALDDLEDAGVIYTSKKGTITACENSGLIKGTFRATGRGGGFVIPDPEYARRLQGDLHVSFGDTRAALNGDRVLASVTEARRVENRNPEGRVLRILERANGTIIGTLMKFNTRMKKGSPSFYLDPDDRRLPFSVIIEDTAGMECVPGSKVAAEITEWPVIENGQLSAAYGNLTVLLGDTDSKEAGIAAILLENQIRTVFDGTVLSEAEEVSKKAVSPDGRLDLRDKLIVTIDSAETKDIDDAVSVERLEDGWLLGVHIADVSEYVQPDTELDKEAFMRGTSVYYGNSVTPMLPQSLSNGACSLNPGEDRYALSALIRLDESGEIQETELHESIVRSGCRCVYSELNDLAEKGDSSEFRDKYAVLLPDALEDMLALYRVLAAKSAARGALSLDSSDEANLILDENGDIVDIVRRERGLTESLIEQFMLCANEAVATWLYWQSMPCVYRVHEEPAPDKLQLFTVFAHNLGLNVTPLRSRAVHPGSLQAIIDEADAKGVKPVAATVMLRCLSKARYAPVCAPHFGLAIDKYCHFTSPIRRYPDLAVHRIIKKVLRGETDPETVDRLTAFTESVSETASVCEKHAQTCERAVDSLLKTYYMEKHIGEEFDAVISSVASFGFYVEPENTCEGLIPLTSLDGFFTFNENLMSLSCGRRVYRLGDRIRVKLEEADTASRKLTYSIAE